jgi:hypothetical protein
MTNNKQQTAVESIIEFCQKQMDNDSSIHKGVYLSIIKFCKEQITEESEIHWKTTLITSKPMEMTNNKEFIPYELALELKQLGFDKPCFGVYATKDGYVRKSAYDENGDAPTYSQAFRWFRETFNLHSNISSWRDDNNLSFSHEFEIYDLQGCWEGDASTTYEEAELACLKKLIEIVKTYGGGEQ